MTYRGQGIPHPCVTLCRYRWRSDAFAASRRMRDIRVSWFETAQARLLTMRGEPPHFSRLPLSEVHRRRASCPRGSHRSRGRNLQRKPPAEAAFPGRILGRSAGLEVEVNARRIPAFATRDRARVRFGSLESQRIDLDRDRRCDEFVRGGASAAAALQSCARAVCGTGRTKARPPWLQKAAARGNAVGSPSW